MVTTDVELEIAQQLKEAGKLLSDPPASDEDLLHIIDQTDKLLSKVDQSPNSLMLEAIRPSMKALVDDRLLNHSNIDVKVSVAACFSEITRITAPDAPYNDEEMKAVFRVIVSSFENLCDKSSQSYEKRVSILDTVSKVRSSLIMLDLECDKLIVEMFEHFLSHDYEDNLLTPMVNIMSLVVEESEEISVDLFKPLLASIKNNTEGILPGARQAGERVIKNCADKLKPYINDLLRNLGGSVDDYSCVLASVCEGTTDVVPVIKGNVETDATLKASGNEGGSTDKDSSKNPEKAIDHPDSNPASKLNTQDSATEKSEKIESKPESKKRGKKTDTTQRESATTSDSPADKITEIPKPIESEVKDVLPKEPEGENAGVVPQRRTIPCKSRSKRPRKKNTSVSLSLSLSTSQDEAPSTEVVLTKAPEGMSDTDIKSPKRVRKKKTFPDDDIPSNVEDSASKRLKKPSKKPETIDPGSKKRKASGKKAGVESVAKKPKLTGKKTEAVDSEGDKSKTTGTKPKLTGKKTDAVESEADKSKTEGIESDSDATPLKQFTSKKEKRKLVMKPSEHTEKKEEGKVSENQPIKPSSKKGTGKSSAPAKSSLKKKEVKKSDVSENVDEKEQPKSLPETDVTDVSPKSTVKPATEDSKVEETPVTGSKRKRAVGKDKAAKVGIKYDDSLVGQKVKVWWPLDNIFYEGVVNSFDSAKKKHTVLYLDGETEALNLKKEKWEFLKDDSAVNEEIPAEATKDEEQPTKKPRNSQDKPKDSAKRAGRAALSVKSKTPTSKSGGKGGSKSTSTSRKKSGKSVKPTDPKEVGVSEEEDINLSEIFTKKQDSGKGKSGKSSGKSVKAADSKEAGVTEEDDMQLSEIIPKKQATQKVYKSKGKAAVMGNQEKAEETKPESLSVNVKESEEDVEAAGDPKGKAAGKAAKSGKKRKKSA